MSIVQVRSGASGMAVVSGRDEPGIQLRALRLVAAVWRQRLSGALVVPGLDGRPPRRLLFADGSLVDRMSFMYLNAALHRGDLRFDEDGVAGRSDRPALGRLLLDRARALARHDRPDRIDGDLVLALDLAGLQSLGLRSGCAVRLIASMGGALPCALLADAREDDDLRIELGALMVLGFLGPRSGARGGTGDPDVVAGYRRSAGAAARASVRLTTSSPDESLEDQTTVLTGSVVNVRALEQLTDDDDALDALLARARDHMQRHEWAVAHDLLIAAHATRFDHARLLAYLALVSLFVTGGDRSESVVRASRYAEMAVALDHADPLVRRLAHQVELHARGDAARTMDLDGLEHANVLALSVV